ncbi:Phosphotransferase enzyme family protein [Streptoalloteichus hindustanus]|uniref:Phosphotransferase enzyme family protein n=1 Tax=Streptoalloteichus hindustanus TaxID=2017 RepID=A0A1M5JGC5_STRHI|nr:Phosphotransferase enzyme family protein [Streptoalloteichus hindustanus]
MKESFLLSGVGLGDSTLVRSLRSGGEMTWLVRSNSGLTPELVVVKRKRDYLSESEFLAHCAVHRRLADAGGPVPGLPASAPDNPVRGPDGALYEIWEWVEGRPVDVASPADLAALGAALAEFHLLADGALDGVDLDPKEPHDRFEKARFHFPLLAEGLGDAGAEQHRALVAAWTAAHERARRETPLPANVLHGDPCPENVLVTGPGRAVLLDLDDVHPGPAVSDLAWSLTRVGAVVPEGDGFRDRWHAEAVAAVLDGYRSRRPLSAAERAALPHWIVASLCCAASDQLYDYGWKIDTAALPAECDRVLALAEPGGAPLPDA